MTSQPTDSPTFYAIIVAGGNGSRMKSEMPKQFLLINGKPILQHTIERFLAVIPVPHIILVLPARDVPTWTALCDQYHFHPPVEIIIGGATRFQSVRNGLNAIPLTESSASAAAFVAVHDGVRPFVSPEIIQTSYQTAAQTGSAVTCVPVKDSVRMVSTGGSSRAIDRSSLRLIQTPQTFELGLFRRAFATDEKPFFTDCASVVEYAGLPITLIDGSYVNIKITTPEDLAWGETVLGR